MIPQVKGIPDIIQQGLKAGWKTWNGSQLQQDIHLEADVVVIGTGAGGGTAAEILSKAGLKVIMVEEGPLKSSNQFNMQEREAFSDLYQEGLARASKDGAITILQGRCVGGSTTVNWTSSFRTPPETLSHWTTEHQLKGFTEAEMAPWFDKMEARLNIEKWALPPNINNSIISKGCDAKQYDWQIIPRNVKGCWNLGYCGTGCPTNAKQSMLVTTIPSTLNQDGELVYLAQARELIIENQKVAGVKCVGLNSDIVTRTGHSITIKARHTIMACGGINGPGLLLRSSAPDPYSRIGKRTFLHPVSFSVADFEGTINGFYGAPQSVYSDHFQWQNGAKGPMGYKIEVNPMQPAFMAAVIMGHGDQHKEQMQNLPHLNSMLALLRDGFDEQSEGGTIELRNNGAPVVDYPINDYIRDGLKRSLLSMAEIQFAAGAKRVRPVHTQTGFSNTLQDLKNVVDNLDYATNAVRIGCAHVMGGCAMGENPETSVVDSRGNFHHLENLSIMDGSIFPTSIGANPQLSIYGMVARQATELAQRLV